MLKALCRATLLSGCVLLLGCTSYEARPIDLPQYEQVFRDRAFEVARTTEITTSDGITRDEGEVLALLFDASLRRARAEAAGALELVEYSGVWADPEFGIELGRIREDIEEPFYADVRLAITIPLSGRLGAEEAAAKAGAEEELRRVLAAEWHTRMQLRARWCSYSAAVERRDVSRALMTELEARLVRLADPRWRAEFDAVALGNWDLLAIERRLELASAEREVERLRYELLERMGLAPEVDLELLAELRGTELPPDEARTAMLEDGNVELAIERAIYLKCEHELDLKVREQYPDLRLGPIYQSDTGLDRMLLGFWLPLPIWNRNGLAIAKASAARESARASVEGAWERARHALRRAELELRGAREDRLLVESTWLPRLDAQQERLQALARSGALDPLAELDLLVAISNARLRAIALRRAEAEAEVQVRALLGPQKNADSSEKEEL